MMFETLLAKLVQEVSLLHLERTWHKWRCDYHGSQRRGTPFTFLSGTHLGVANRFVFFKVYLHLLKRSNVTQITKFAKGQINSTKYT